MKESRLRVSDTVMTLVNGNQSTWKLTKGHRVDPDHFITLTQ